MAIIVTLYLILLTGRQEKITEISSEPSEDRLCEGTIPSSLLAVVHKLILSLFQGFRYFATHVRGREELVCSIINEPSLPILLSTSTSPSSSFVRNSGAPLLPKEP